MIKKIARIIGIFTLLFLPISLLSFLAYTVFHQVILFVFALIAAVIAVYVDNLISERSRLNREVFVQAYELKKTKETIQAYSATDTQTQVYNERFLNLRLTEECDRARRYQRPLSCLLVDIDSFSSLTQQYGHVLSEVVLQEIAEFLRENTRSVDVIIRYGGNQFVVILPETALMQSRIVAERIRYSVEKNIFRLEGKAIKATVSIGYVCFESTLHRGKDDVLSSLEKAVNEASKGGPNHIATISGETG